MALVTRLQWLHYYLSIYGRLAVPLAPAEPAQLAAALAFFFFFFT
jgi:hypothetical protein